MELKMARKSEMGEPWARMGNKFPCSSCIDFQPTARMPSDLARDGMMEEVGHGWSQGTGLEGEHDEATVVSDSVHACDAVRV